MRVRGKGEEKNPTGTEQGRKAEEEAEMALMWTHITISHRPLVLPVGSPVRTDSICPMLPGLLPSPDLKEPGLENAAAKQSSPPYVKSGLWRICNRTC